MFFTNQTNDLLGILPQQLFEAEHNPSPLG